jgi:hypothetical protein
MNNFIMSRLMRVWEFLGRHEWLCLALIIVAIAVVGAI